MTPTSSDRPDLVTPAVRPLRLRAMQQTQVVVIYEQRISDAILDQPFGIPRVYSRIVTIEDASPAEAPMPIAA